MDMYFLKLLSEIRNPVLTTINMVITSLGGGTLYVALLCLIYWCIDKKFAYRLGIIYILSGMAVHSLKVIFRIPRPWVRDPSFNVVKAAKPGAGGYSFPSGHTQNTTAFLSTLAYRCKKPLLKLLCYMGIFLMMFSRMYLGVHTPTDVGVAFLLTLLISLYVNHYGENYSIDIKTIHKINIFMVLISAAVTILVIYLYATVPELPVSKLIGTVKFTGAAFGFIIGLYIEKNYIRFNEKATTFPKQILKFAIGIIVSLALHKGLSFIIKTFFAAILPLYFFEYALLFVFVICVYPIFIKKFFTDEFYL